MHFARMAKLVYALALSTSPERGVGSSPTSRTRILTEGILSNKVDLCPQN